MAPRALRSTPVALTTGPRFHRGNQRDISQWGTTIGRDLLSKGLYSGWMRLRLGKDGKGRFDDNQLDDASTTKLVICHGLHGLGSIPHFELSKSRKVAL